MILNKLKILMLTILCFTFVSCDSNADANANEEMTERDDGATWVEDKNGCKLLNQALIEVDTGKTLWEGKCEKGFASGSGKLTMTLKGEKLNQKVCSGTMQSGILEGEVECKWMNGTSFSGTMKDNKRNGQGTMNWINAKYTGNWKDNRAHGQGTYEWLKHSMSCSKINTFYCNKSFVGNFIKGDFGKGVFTKLDGTTSKLNKNYAMTLNELIKAGQGGWVKDQNGCAVWSGTGLPVVKTTWFGDCVNGYISGKGSFTMSWSGQILDKTSTDSIKCIANFKKGKLNGYSECEWESGLIYKGIFKDSHVVSGDYISKGKKDNTQKVHWFEEKNGCLVWNPAPQPNEQVSWDGECLNGYAKGKGKLTYLTKNQEQLYVGEMSNGRRNGKGVFTYVKHSKACKDDAGLFSCIKEFSGTHKNGIDESGFYTLSNGATLKKKNINHNVLLEWTKDQNGCLVFNSFAVEKLNWSGDCNEGFASGDGKLSILWKSKEEKEKNTLNCTGTLKRGKLHGYNDCKWGNGNQYAGNWKNNEESGEGKKTWSDAVYTGNWRNGKRNGKGELASKNGDTYSGEWKDDKKHGEGELVYSNGNKYSGHWEKNKKHGKGTYTWKKHDKPCTNLDTFSCYEKFEGEFIYDRFGKGIFTLKKGKDIEKPNDFALDEDDLKEAGRGGWAKTNKKCKVWNGTTSPVVQSSWTGQCVDGYISGNGYFNMVWKKTKEEKTNPSVDCNGRFHKGKLNGYAECKWANGTSYVGTYKNDKAVRGKYTYANGRTREVKLFEEENGCLVSNPDPQPDETVTWDGACYNGYAYGKGTLKYVSATLEQSYIGNLNKGQRHDTNATYQWHKHDKPCDEKNNISSCYKTFEGKFIAGNFDKGIFTLISGKQIVGKDQWGQFQDTMKESLEAQLQMLQFQHTMDLMYQHMDNVRRTYGQQRQYYGYW